VFSGTSLFQNRITVKPGDSGKAGLRLPVSGTLSVLTAADFNDEFLFQADKAGSIRAENMLAPKLAIGTATISQLSPQPHLGRRLIFTKVFHKMAHQIPLAPHPAPSPHAGRGVVFRSGG
jgi:hypothetical protein